MLLQSTELITFPRSVKVLPGPYVTCVNLNMAKYKDTSDQ